MPGIKCLSGKLIVNFSSELKAFQRELMKVEVFICLLIYLKGMQSFIYKPLFR